MAGSLCTWVAERGDGMRLESVPIKKWASDERLEAQWAFLLASQPEQQKQHSMNQKVSVFSDW